MAHGGTNTSSPMIFKHLNARVKTLKTNCKDIRNYVDCKHVSTLHISYQNGLSGFKA